MCTQIVSCLTNFEEGEEDALEEAEEGKLEEESGSSEEIHLVLELSGDLDEKETAFKKEKVNNCRQHQEERREQERVKKDISEFYGHSWRMIFRQKLQELTPGRADKRKNIAEIKQMEDELFGEV